MPATNEFKEKLRMLLEKLASFDSNSKEVDDYIYHCLLFSSNFAPIPEYPKWSDYLGQKCEDAIRKNKTSTISKIIADITKLIHALEYGAIEKRDVVVLDDIARQLENEI